MTEDYVSFETAKLLKERGFDGDTNCYYIEGSVDKNLCYSPIRQNHNKRIANNEFGIDIDITNSKISAPTLQMATKWLREVHNVVISIFPAIETDMIIREDYSYVIYKNKISVYQNCSINYEQACEAAIKYCIKNLI